MDIVRKQAGENTRAVHLPAPPTPSQQPLGTPVYRTAAFSFDTSEEYRAVLNDEMPGYTYSRIDNPTVDAFARAVAALEGVNLPRWPAAQAFASGMAAISGVFWTFARAGAHVVARVSADHERHGKIVAAEAHLARVTLVVVGMTGKECVRVNVLCFADCVNLPQHRSAAAMVPAGTPRILRRRIAEGRMMNSQQHGSRVLLRLDALKLRGQVSELHVGDAFPFSFFA